VSDIAHRVDLTESSFPLLTEELGQTVLVPNIRGRESREERNQPQLYYCHNVVPKDRGIGSVGFISVLAAVPSVTTFSEPRVIFSSSRNRIYLALTTDGNIYSSALSASPVWQRVSSTQNFVGRGIAIGTVNGISYIYFSNLGAFTCLESNNSLVSAPLTGINLANSLGVVASSGYLVVYTEDALAWSSTVDPTDFTPSDITGAGGANVSEIEGKITFCLPNSTGFIIYTETNSVSATFSGNKRFPFKFKAIDNSKGAENIEFAAYEANSAEHFVYSKAGLQSLNSRRATTLLPELTDFLSGKVFEDFDEDTDSFVITELTSSMLKKLKLIASRYLVISYGVTTYTHALIYDISLKKMGKLKITHVDVFEYINDQEETAKESVAFLLASGEVKLLDSSSTATSSGVAIFGKFQYIRNRLLELSHVKVQTVKSTDTFSITDLVSLDGDTVSSKVLGTIGTLAAKYRKYYFRTFGINHTLVLKGKFNLFTLALSFKSRGKR